MKRKRNLNSDPLKPFPDANSNSRPVHKEAARLRRVEAEISRKHPEPMTLMHKREKNNDIIPAALKGTATRGQIEQAARAMAAWDNSDPFAYGRTALHVSQGFERSEEIVKEMGQRTLARQAAKRKEVEDAKSKIG